MSDIKIDKNVPIPKNSGRGKYPWTDMEVGDSFCIPTMSISMGAVNERYKPKTFIMRKVDDGYRVWRTA